MKNTIIALLLILFATSGYSQNLPDSKKENLTKKELRTLRKTEQAKKDSTSHTSAMYAIKASNWIFKATTITSLGGRREYVAANVNYLMIEDNLFTFQTSTGFGGGYNNMGGITTKGLVKGMNSSVDKHGNVSYTFKMLGTLFNANVTLNLMNEGNSAEIFMNFDRGEGSIIMDGSIYMLGITNLYEGTLN
ncbi:MAG: DUF4251 domain-containing protein [Bacteroidales bacterium]